MKTVLSIHHSSLPDVCTAYPLFFTVPVGQGLNCQTGGVEKFLHGRMSRPEFFEPENPIKSYTVVDNCWCTVHVYLNFNCFQIISLITSQAKIDSLQPVAEIMGEDRWTVPPKVLMGSAGLTVPHHVGLQHLGVTFKPSISMTTKPGVIINY